MDENEVIIGAMVPERLAKIVKEKAEEEGVLFSIKAGYYLLLGLESERKQEINK